MKASLFNHKFKIAAVLYKGRKWLSATELGSKFYDLWEEEITENTLRVMLSRMIGEGIIRRATGISEKNGQFGKTKHVFKYYLKARYLQSFNLVSLALYSHNKG